MSQDEFIKSALKLDASTYYQSGYSEGELMMQLLTRLSSLSTPENRQLAYDQVITKITADQAKARAEYIEAMNAYDSALIT